MCVYTVYVDVKNVHQTFCLYVWWFGLKVDGVLFLYYRLIQEVIFIILYRLCFVDDCDLIIIIPSSINEICPF